MHATSVSLVSLRSAACLTLLICLPFDLSWVAAELVRGVGPAATRPTDAEGITPPVRDGETRAPQQQGAVRSKKSAREAGKGKPRQPQKQPAPFRWVNPPRGAKLPGLTHQTFRSPSMGLDVGYCIYLPTAYHEAGNSAQRFPVVYYLHGGRPGSESKSIRLITKIHEVIESGAARPLIYVFVNGGPISHYNLPDRKHSMGADVFIKELIPHIDATYRTVASREGRGLEGFSQGGRGTTRLMFRYPELFRSVAPGGAGYATEKRISQDNGRENPNLVFQPGDNTWDLARLYAKRADKPALEILIHVGTAGFNYTNNLEYMSFLESLGIPFQRLIVPDVPHSAVRIYQEQGDKLVKFHSTNLWKHAAQGESDASRDPHRCED